ncbi:MAG TPA: hypothetical protein VG842_06675, partial [Sediminibacterium sp.]|nr:hypothetical protein [Sediminibacterium sp.]
MGLIDRILTTEEMTRQPPVLIDIGASGSIHKKWKKIAPYATCIAFDADERDFDPGSSEKSRYKKLLIRKSLVSNQAGKAADFYLTASPHCSSLLKPDHVALADWAFAPIFAVEQVVQLDTTDIPSALAAFGITYIDWYKSDSQGIDLKLFKSLPDNIRSQISIAEFEPGILDAYHNEDKLDQMLSYHDQLKIFWLAELIVKGPLRIPHEQLNKLIRSPFLQKLLGKLGQTSPGWAEITYCNAFKHPATQTKRSLLMGWIGATLIKQHGFAYTLADKGIQEFGDPIFKQMQRASARKLLAGFLSFRYL